MRARSVGIALCALVVLVLASCGQRDARTTATSAVPRAASVYRCAEPSQLRRGQVVQGDATEASHPYDAWGLRTLLLQRLPQHFGGLYGDGGTLVLLATSGHQSEVEALKKEFDGTNPGGGRPTYRIDEATNTLARLEKLRTLLLDKHSELKARGVVVTGFGPDDNANALGVGLLDDTAAARDAVMGALRACPSEIRFSQEDISTAA